MIRPSRQLRQEAFNLLEGHGRILEAARTVTAALDAAGLDGAVVDGVAVVLHGYVRTTLDVDVWVDAPLRTVAARLRAAGLEFDPPARQFRFADVPVHLLRTKDLRAAKPTRFTVRQAVRIVALDALIEMKLRSGLRSPARAQDLADVVGLIRARGLSRRFASRLSPDLREDFRRLVQALRAEGGRRSVAARSAAQARDAGRPAAL